MKTKEIIKTRKSIRTFDGRKISPEDKEKISDYIKNISNPYNIRIEFVILECEKFGLSSPVIEGEDFYIASKVPKVEYCEEALGYSFEKMVLYLWSLGIGTTWIGGTLDRPLFEKAANTGNDEYMMIVTPVGYPSDNPSKVDKDLRESVHGDERLPYNELFYNKDFNESLNEEIDCLEAVRWAPSAANRQPWRIIKENNLFHFYLEHTPGYKSSVGWDVQKIDMGITLCHFQSMCEGKFEIKDPKIKIDENIEYIASIRRNNKL